MLMRVAYIIMPPVVSDNGAHDIRRFDPKSILNNKPICYSVSEIWIRCARVTGQTGLIT